jgi:regulator of sigma E protease
MADKKVVDIQRAKLMMVASSDSTQPASTQYSYYDTTLILPENFDELLSKKSDMPFFAPRLSFVVGKLTGGGNAYKAGFDVGDAIQKVEGKDVLSFFEFKETLVKYAGQRIKMQVKDTTGKTTVLTVDVNADATIGFQPKFSGFENDEKIIKYGLGESVNKGVSRSFGLIGANAKALGNVASGKTDASKSLAGPVGIAQMFGGTWDWVNFWTLTAMLSLVLAFMNILPIPALDGGHVMFLLYEIIARRPVSEKVLYVGQVIGMVILLSLVAFTFWVDIARALGI